MDERVLTTEQLVERYTPLIHKIVNELRWRSQVIDHDDLFQVGVEGLINAYKQWDPAKATFITYAYNGIRWAVLREIQKTQWSRTRSAKHLREDRKVISGDYVVWNDGLETILDMYVDETATYEDVERELDNEGLELRLRGLTTIERTVVLKRYVDELTFEAIGKEVGLTRQRIQQIEKQALNKLRQEFAHA